MTTSGIPRRARLGVILLVSRVANEPTHDEDDDTNANHQADVLHRDLALLIRRVGFEKGRSATVRGLAARRTHVSRGTNHF